MPTCSARYSIYYGEGRDAYDVRGRTAHESVFNINDGSYRCPSTQQGYSPFSTWTRGLAWGLLGFAEQLEFFASLSQSEIQSGAPVKRAALLKLLLKAATAAADFYVAHACTDGIPVWDTGAPNLSRLGDYAAKPADPFNGWEPVDSSAAAIAGQGLIRLGNHLIGHGAGKEGNGYRRAGLAVARTLFNEPYLSIDLRHQGLILHSVYHRPNGWDYVAPGQKIAQGESSMWGDYHARELALLLLREARMDSYLTFFSGLGAGSPK